VRQMTLAAFLLALASLQALDSLAYGGAQEQPAPENLVFEHEDECGRPLVDSLAWIGLHGTAASVTDGRTFTLRTSDGKKIIVDLLALDPGSNPAPARKLLASLIQGQPVTVLVHPHASASKRVGGVVHVGTKDINRELLRAGVARYQEPPSGSVSSYSLCLYRIAEREAKQAKSGLWQ
jgi:endonuclease YncB( thermonuclease family)